MIHQIETGWVQIADALSKRERRQRRPRDRRQRPDQEDPEDSASPRPAPEESATLDILA